MNPRDVLKYGHLTVMRTVEQFPQDKATIPEALGYWSVKDVIAHLASYELILVEILGNIVEPCPTPLVDEFKRDRQAFNDRQVDLLRKAMSMDEALAEYKSAYQQVAALANLIPNSAWRQNGILPWYGDDYDLEDFIVYTFYAHKREHCGQIDVFRDRVTGD